MMMNDLRMIDVAFQPVTLLPKRLADIQDDIGTEKVRLATLADVRDQMEIDRLGIDDNCC